MPRRVFITGASSGIGEALARHYAAQGAELGLFARRRETLERLALETGAGERCRIYAGDVTEADAVAAAAADFLSSGESPDLVIANAGVSRGTLTEMREDLPAFERVLRVNVMGLVHTFSPFVAPMRAAAEHGARPTLAGVASIAGFRGIPGSGAYSASKAAAIAYLESLRVELRGSGITVTTICPGYIDTPMTARNPYRMPFLMPADRAAALIAAAIDRRSSFYVLPWQMSIAGRMLKWLPNWAYDRLFARAPRKPRDARL
jgi:short-subunit dehydrogenase